MRNKNVTIEYSAISIINKSDFIFSFLSSNNYNILKKVYKESLYKENELWHLKITDNFDFISKVNKLIDIGICFNQGMSMGDLDLTPAQKVHELNKLGLIKKAFISSSRIGLHLNQNNGHSVLIAKF